MKAMEIADNESGKEAQNYNLSEHYSLSSLSNEREKRREREREREIKGDERRTMQIIGALP